MKKFLLVIPFFLLFSFCHIAKAEIVFQDDFSYYDGTGWTPSTPANAGTIAGGTLQNPGRGEPHNWTGWIRSGSDYIGISPNEGIDGGACFKISNQITSQAGQVGLVKYLGENGYNELYIRFFMKFDENHRFGNGTNGSFNFYKVIRLWQGLTNQNIYDGIGVNSELGKGAIIWGFYENAYAEFAPYYAVGAMRDGVNETVNCISNQSCINFSYYPYSAATNGGHLNSLFGPLTASGYWQNPQTWHQIDIHVKLASTFNGNDGVFEQWIDGIKQNNFTWVQLSSSGQVLTIESLPTAQVGNGINYIVLNDNRDGTSYWTTPSYVMYDNVTISTTPIESSQDSTAPTGSVLIQNNNTYATSTSVSLSLSATDSSGVSTMKISNSNNFSGATEIAYNTVHSWTLAASDGLKTVYAWFKDTIGNWMSSPSSDTITLDTSAPVISLVGDISYSTGSTTPNITFSSTEAGSITYSGSCNSSTNQAIVGNNNITFNSLAAGTYSNCTIRMTDAATNNSNTLTIPQFTVQTSSPTCTSFTYSSWSSCQSNSTRTRTVVTSSPSSCTGGSPVLSESCTYVSTCTSFTYSAWSSCQSNSTRTRTVLTSSPSSCTGGSPVTSESCTYTSGASGAGGSGGGSSNTTTSTSTTNIATSTQITTTQATSTKATTSSKILTNDKNTDQKIATSTNSTVSQSSSGEIVSTLYGQSNEIVQKISLSEAKTISGHLSFTPLLASEATAYQKISTQCDIDETNKYAIAKFIHDGTATTQKLGAGERAGVIGSFCKAFEKSPSTEADWQDIIKIANGRWAAQKNTTAEEKTKIEWFKKIYQRLPNMSQANDNAAVTIITYGLRPVTRNTQSEKNGINIFKNIFKRAPSASLDWDIVRAIAYSGAKR